MAEGESGKRRAAMRALEEVQDGMVLGLGSGSTTAHAIRALGRQLGPDTDTVGVATSHQAAREARTAGIPLRCLTDVDGIDLALDGADQVAGLSLVKGGGGAHTREKVIDAAAERFVVLVDESKLTDVLDHPIPVEVIPDATSYVERRVRDLEGEPRLRTAERTLGPSITDNGNFIVDCDFGRIDRPRELDEALSMIPGVVDHGLFVGLADAVYIGSEAGVERRERGT